MTESIKDIIIRIVAQSEGFESFNTASSSLNQMSVGLQEAEAHASSFGTGLNDVAEASVPFTDRLSESAKGLQSVGEFGYTAMHMMDRFEISQLNVASAQATVINAQQKYNEALAKYGEHSQQAFIASNVLARAQDSLEKANLRANLSMALIGVTMVGQIPKFIEFGVTAATTMKGVVASIMAGEVSAEMFAIRLKALVPELLIISAVAGGVYYMIQSQAAAAQEASQQMTDTLSQGFTDANEAATKLKSEIDAINNSLQSADDRANEAEQKRLGAIKAINESSLSAAQKRAEIEKANADYNKEIINIRLSGDSEALKSAKDKSGVLADMQTQQKKLTTLELEGQTKVKAGGQLRGVFASALSDSVGAGGTAPVDISEAVSPFLVQVQQEKQNELDVNVKTWSAGALSIQQEPSLISKAMPYIAGAGALVTGSVALHDIPQALKGDPTITGGLLEKLQALISRAGTLSPTVGIPILPATEGFREAMKNLNVTIVLDRQGTRDFFKDGFVNTLNYG